ncbi:NADPH:quinone oxidoreductase family protein [Micromonospora radicis]|uniref:NADPH:quinone oxidoreductase family protein n=1 Tax=Micromonospora radicis TaxID=1894971 RepID=A0A418MNS7_9ACTN|nr:NADPH:quinone oxidoreductase family protein [Micromonospora radicis]RIV32705.1 NADPH:quinone oxidoreductase family protein [Micromonospora radicis]
MIRRLVAYRTGEPTQVLSVAELPDDPPPGPGEVQLAVRAVGLNFLDVSLCRGEYPVRPEPPMTPGVEAAGRIVAAGPGAEQLLGQEVIACPALPRGALGSTVTVDATLVVARPPTMEPTIAAALPVTYQTAWFALERARVTAGDVVLVHAGAGGVGIAVTQLAVARGARVIATAGSPAKTALCRAEGAAVAVDYTSEDFVAVVREATGGQGVDVVIDPVGGDVLARSLDCLAFEGRLVTVGAAGGAPPPVDPARLIAANADLVGLSWGSTYPWRRPAAVRAAYQTLFDLCAAGAVRPPVARVVSLAQTPQALDDLASRRTTGKIIVRLDEGEQ